MQNLIKTFFEVLEKLESENIQYMVVGSIASMIYGEPRMTHDLDLVLEIRGILSETNVDQDYLNKWIKSLSLENQWQKI